MSAHEILAPAWRVRWVARTGSTNADVAEAARAGEATGLVVVADHQEAGRGRLDRSWRTDPGTGIAVSVLLRPQAPVSRWSWLPLLTGVAVVDAIDTVTHVPAVLKWPNDVLAGGGAGSGKLAGILAERVETPDGPAVVVGVGLNLAPPRDLPGAASLGLTADGDRQRLVTALLTALTTRVTAFDAAQGDPTALRADYLRRNDTVGREVRAHLPGGGVLTGRAVDIDSNGCLVVHTAVDTVALGAGDIVHLRRADQRDVETR